MPSLVKNVVDMFNDAADATLGWSGLLKLTKAGMEFVENSGASEFMDVMREKSKAAYDAYCEEAQARDWGTPDKKAVLDYWQHCMEEDTYPTARDFQVFTRASEEESERMLRFLIEQWMTVYEFTLWLHGIANSRGLAELAHTLELLPQQNTMIQRIEDSLKTLLDRTSAVSKIQYITYQTVMEARDACTEDNVRNYYRITNQYTTMLRVISAGRDIPHQKACAKLHELLQNGKPVIIAGNGGLGKSSLMLRAAVEWAQSGGVAVWLPLSASATGETSDSWGRAFYDALLRDVEKDGNILLCIESPYAGHEKSFPVLRANWPEDGRIRLLMAERSNRLAVLGESGANDLSIWFDNAHVLDLRSAGNVDYDWFQEWIQERGYHYWPFPEEPDRRRRILDTGVTVIAKDVTETERTNTIARVLKRYDRPNVSLAELIYRTLFALLKKNVSKTSDIRLDWDEWVDFLKNAGYEKANPSMYGMIAAFQLFDTPLTLSFFCRYWKDLDENWLSTMLMPEHIQNQMEPVIYDPESETLRPKHDVIAELYFLFHKNTLNLLMNRIISVMDSEETESLLEQMVDKQEFLRGSVYSLDISYQDYLNRIQKRMDAGEITLGPGGRANLCTGNLWLKARSGVTNEEIETYLTENAPPMESFVRGTDFRGINFHGMAKLYTEWGMWEQNRGNLAEAEQRFKAVLTMGTKEETIFARTVLGRFLTTQSGREAEAENTFKTALEIEPNNIYVLTGLGRLLEKQCGREAEAEGTFKKVLEIEPNNIYILTELGRLLAKQRGREAEAEDTFKKVLKIEPDHAFIWVSLGRLLIQQNHSEEAEKIFREGIEKCHNSVFLQLELGRLLKAQSGREQDAETAFMNNLEAHPNSFTTYIELGRLLAKQRGREKGAEAVFQEALKIDPDNVPARTGLGRLLAKLGREKEAEAVFRKAIAIDPKNIPPRTELGRLLAKQRGREKEAEAVFQEALKIDPKNIPPRTELGRLLVKLGREKEAEAVFQEALKINPKNLPPHTELGRLLTKLGREKEAEALFQKVLKIDPDNVPARIMLAKLYENQRKFADAEKLYEEVRQLQPGDPRTDAALERVRRKQASD
ncbi:MAG: tetratricopeptide repeat protein [Oscillibacter sp.]|nr:tetratricopeptide repeat protein [Oscillibacter sp.]